MIDKVGLPTGFDPYGLILFPKLKLSTEISISDDRIGIINASANK